MTRTTRPILAALLAATLATPAWAQQDHQAHHPEGQAEAAAPSAGPGMSGGMMRDMGGGQMMGGEMMRGMRHGSMMSMHGMMTGGPGRHMAGRLAFLEAELGITDEQQDEWEAFASAAREAMEGMRPMHEAMMSRQDRPPLPERLQLMESMMQGRLDAMRGVHEELTALYEALSPEQRETADELFGMMM